MRTVTFDDLIQHFGSKANMARVLKRSYSCINQWGLRSGVSEAGSYMIERATGGKFKARQIVLAKTKSPRPGE